MTMTYYNDLTMISGGANGADTIWGDYVKLVGGNVKHYIFSDYNIKNKNDTHIVDYKILDEYEPLLKETARKLNKNVPHNRYIRNLLLRSCHVVANVDSLYAIINSNDIYSGGTGWTIAMFQILTEYAKDTNKQLWIASQTNSEHQWISWNLKTSNTLSNILPPKATGTCGMVGTRALTYNGEYLIKRFITRSLFKQITNDPKISDIIYVPERETNYGKLKGGYSKINRVITGMWNNEPTKWVYISKIRHPDLTEWRWNGQDGLMNRQLEYMIKYGDIEANEI